MKQRVKTYYGGYAANDPAEIGKLARTRTLCSCWQCGNPRKYFHKLTIQEQKHLSENVSTALE